MTVVGVLAAASACSHRAPAPASDRPQVIIEKPALMISGSAVPGYPEELQATRDTGTVLVHLTVTEAGRPDMKTVEIVSSPHAAFTRAVMKVLPQARFIPAEIVQPDQQRRGGCRTDENGVQWCRGPQGTTVRMGVQIRFVFAPSQVHVSSPAPPPR